MTKKGNIRTTSSLSLCYREILKLKKKNDAILNDIDSLLDSLMKRNIDIMNVFSIQFNNIERTNKINIKALQKK